MTFEIDPRVCLRTGKDLAGSDNPCCDYDHIFNDRPRGLSAELNERAGYQDYRAKMTEKAQSGYRGEDGLFSPEAYVMPPSPSDFLNVRSALPVETIDCRGAGSAGSLRRISDATPHPPMAPEARALASSATPRPVYVPPGPNRREAFTEMLRRMFGRSAV